MKVEREALATQPSAGVRAVAALRVHLRSAGIAATASALLAVYGICRLARGFAGPEAAERLFSRGVVVACRILGPTFVKVAQIAGTRPDLLPAQIHRNLAPLRHSVSARRFSSLSAHLPQPLRAALASGRVIVEEPPIAAGSIACVYRAHDTATRRVLALKIQRPRLRETIVADFAIIKAIGGLAARLPMMRALPVAQSVSELETLILRQTDFRLEADNLRDFGTRYAGWPQLILPGICEEFTSGAVIAMDYIPGVEKDWIDGADALTAARQAEVATRFLFEMVFVAGRVHADLHPGNLVFRRDGSIAVLDFGMISEMTPAARRMFVYFFFGLITNSPGMCTHVLVSTALGSVAGFDEVRFGADVADLIGRHTALNAAQYEVARFIGDLFSLQRAHGLRPSPDFLTTVLAFLMLEGTVKALAPDYDFQAAARDYILKNAIRSGIFAR